MKRLRLIGLLILAAGLSGLFAMADTKQVTEPDPEESWAESWAERSLSGYDAFHEFSELKENPYISDKNAALTFRLAAEAGQDDRHEDAVECYRVLRILKYPYAEKRLADYRQWFDFQDALARYDSVGAEALSPDELEWIGVYFDDEGDRETAIKLLETAWNRGCKTAASTLGQLYYGRGFGKSFLDGDNSQKVLEWTEKGIAAGDSIAMFNMGVFYDEGMIKPYDPAIAAIYYAKAAEMNVPQALNNLSCLYLGGTGVEKDVNKAVELIERAAEVGHQYASVNRATYELRRGNYDKCRHYLSKALMADRTDIYERLIDEILFEREGKSLQDNPEMLAFLKYLYDEGMTSDLLDENYADNVATILVQMEIDPEIVAEIAKDGDPDAKKCLIWDKMYGLKSAPDRKDGLRMLEEWVKADPRYELALGYAYWNQGGIAHDFKKAKQHISEFLKIITNQQNEMEKALEEGDEAWEKFSLIEWPASEYFQSPNLYPECCPEDDSLGWVDELDHLIDLENRKDKIIKKAEDGDTGAMIELYDLIDNSIYIPYTEFGLGVPALRYLTEAAQAGDLKACERLSEDYNSRGLYPAATYWYRKAFPQE